MGMDHYYHSCTTIMEKFDLIFCLLVCETAQTCGTTNPVYHTSTYHTTRYYLAYATPLGTCLPATLEKRTESLSFPKSRRRSEMRRAFLLCATPRVLISSLCSVQLFQHEDEIRAWSQMLDF